MQIVIEIDDDDYQFIQDTEFENYVVTKHLYEAVYEGTLLPKRHGRLIDADYLREDFKTSKKISFAERMDISCIVDHAPTIIEADMAESE